MITIIGSGKVGGDAALFSAIKKLDDQILLLDIVEGLPQGEAMDLNHMLAEQGNDTEIIGSNDYAQMEGSDVVVIVAGSGRKPGMTRMDLLNINSKIVKQVVESVKKYAKDSIIVPVTNPLDPMAYVCYKVSEFSKSRVFGMGNMLDLSRFIQLIHEETGFSRNSIRGLVIGEHGENMLPLPRLSSVSGIPLPALLSKDKMNEITNKTRQVAAEVIKLKGATVHAPGNAISSIIESIKRNQKRVIPVATYLEGEYDISDITLGVPAEIGKEGINKIIEVELEPEEKEWMEKSAQSVKNAVSSLNL